VSNSPKFTRQIFLWLAQVNADRDLPVSGVKFGFALCSHFNEAEGGAAWPGIEEIGKAMGRSKPVVIDGREHIVAAGHLRFQPGSRGSGHSGRYWMILKGNPDLPFADQIKGSPDLPFPASAKGSPSRTQKVARPKRKGSPGLHESSNEPPKEPPIDRPLDDLLAKLIKAAKGNVVREEIGIEVIKPILDLEAQGCSEADVIAAVGEVVPKLKTPLRTWAAPFLRDAILAKRDARLRAGNGSAHARAGNGAEPGASKPAAAETDEAKWRRFFDAWAKGGDGSWFMSWEPSPGAWRCPILDSVLLPWLREIVRSHDAPPMHVTSAIRQIEARFDLPEKEKA